MCGAAAFLRGWSQSREKGVVPISKGHVTKDLRLGSLNQQECAVSQLWRLEV